MTRHRRRRHTRKQRGGELANNPPSAWGWGMGTVGNGWTQFMNSLTLQPGQNIGAAGSNDIVPVGNPNAQTMQGNIGPSLTGSVPQGGGRRRRGKHRGKRGGSMGSALATAAVPGALFLLNQTMGCRRKRRTHKRR